VGALAREAAGLDFEALAERSRDLAVLPDRLARRNGDLPAHLRAETNAFLARAEAAERYVPRPISVPVHLFPAQGNAPGASPAWNELLPAASMRVTPVPGTHFSMMQAPNVAAVGRALSAELERVREEGLASLP
jgi:thioesterase domain-containing protein